MSNCSRQLVADFLQALGSESALIGRDIAALGETLDKIAGAGRGTIVAMQAFDALSQSARAQGLLLAGLSYVLRGDHLAGPALVRLVDEIPLPQVRRRLLRALDMDAPEPCRENATTLWGVP